MRGAIVLHQKWSRGQVETRLANLPPRLIGMEACVGAHHLSRRLKLLGHDARLMPARYVRPYSKGQKNDFRDAEAIAEAVQRPTMKFVATKTAEQLDLQALHRVRERLVSQRTGVINQIRAFLLERGVAVRQGLRFLRAELPAILATGTEVLSPRMVRVVEELAGGWCRLDERIEGLSTEIAALAYQDAACKRLMMVPGVGPIISSAMVAARRWRCVLQRPRLRRLAGARPEANLDGRSHDPRQDIQARQSLPARPVRTGGLGRADQTEKLGTLRAQALDRSRQEAIAPQRAGDRASQQIGPHCLGCTQQGAELRMHQQECDVAPTSLSVAPCSDRSTRGLATPKQEARSAATASLDRPLRAAPRDQRRLGRRNGLTGTNKGTA